VQFASTKAPFYSHQLAPVRPTPPRVKKLGVLEIPTDPILGGSLPTSKDLQGTMLVHGTDDKLVTTVRAVGLKLME
jgi:hypothetical protein